MNHNAAQLFEDQHEKATMIKREQLAKQMLFQEQISPASTADTTGMSS